MAYRCNSGQFPYFGKEWVVGRVPVWICLQTYEKEWGEGEYPKPLQPIKVWVWGACFAIQQTALPFNDKNNYFLCNKIYTKIQIHTKLEVFGTDSYKLLFKIMPNLKKLPKDF